MICVLDVTAGPAQGKRFWIRNEERMEIGRISTADFSVPTDKHMSRHHLILEGGAGCFRIRDVGSANGTYVNDAKVATIELCNGDLVKAGETIFEVSVIHDSTNLDDSKESTSVSSALTSESSGAQKVLAVTHQGPDSTDRSSADSLAQQCSSSAGSSSSVVAGSREGEPWLSLGFQKSGNSQLLKQTANATGNNIPAPASLSEIVHTLAKIHRATILIRTDRLRRFEQQLMDKISESKDAVRRPSKDVAAILGTQAPDLPFLIESLVGRDAMLLFASPNTSSDAMLREVSELLPPSNLELYFSGNPANEVPPVFQDCEWIMLEQSGAEYLQVWLHD